MTARSEDQNGYIEIKGNPISKVGVFDYSGAQISPSLDPHAIYKVYRPEEELSDPECIESFRLIPLINDHAMLGATADGLMPPEKKGIDGVIGEDVYFEGGYLKGNLRLFSENLSKVIENGKKQLSAGYRCVYDAAQGIYEGIRYDFIQRKLRGNHVAVVEEGRSGPDVAVLDHFTFTFDTKEILNMMEHESAEKHKEEVADAEGAPGLSEKLDRILEVLGKLVNVEKEEVADAEGENRELQGPDDPGNQESAVGKDAESSSELSKEVEGMDAKLKAVTNELNQMKQNGMKLFLSEIHKRDKLAKELSSEIGVFDSSLMTLDEVVKYGVTKLKDLKKLNVSCSDGQEEGVLQGYLEGVKKQAFQVSAKAYDAKIVDADSPFQKLL